MRLGKTISQARLGVVEHANILNSGKEESTAAIRTFMAAVEQPLEGKKNFKKIITEQRLLQLVVMSKYVKKGSNIV